MKRQAVPDEPQDDQKPEKLKLTPAPHIIAHPPVNAPPPQADEHELADDLVSEADWASEDHDGPAEDPLAVQEIAAREEAENAKKKASQARAPPQDNEEDDGEAVHSLGGFP